MACRVPLLLSLCISSTAVPVLRVGGFPGPRGQIAFELWRDWVNANSGTAKHTVTLDLAPYNATTYQADVTAGIANWDVVIPPYGSGPSDDFVIAVNGAKPVLVWGGAAEASFNHDGAVGDKVFGTFTPASRYFESGLTAVSAAGATTVAFVQNDSPFSAACCLGAQNKATELGMTSGGSFTYDRTDDDATIAAKAAEVATTNADVVVNCGHEQDTVKMVKALNDLDTSFCPKAMLATNSLLNVADNYQGAYEDLPRGIMMPTQWSTLAENVVDPITGWTESALLAAYASLSGGTAMTYHASSALLSGLSITAAMQTLTAETYDEGAFLTAMRAVDVTTVVGRVKFSAVAPRGANTLKPMMTQQLQADHEIVAPCASKTRDPEYPRLCAGGSASSESLAVCSGTGDNIAEGADASTSAGHLRSFFVMQTLSLASMQLLF